MRNALAHPGKTQRRIVSTWIGIAFAQDDATSARKQWRDVADQARSRVPRLATLMDDVEVDVLAYLGSPVQYRARCTAPTHSSASTARSNAAARSSGSSPTKPRSRA